MARDPAAVGLSTVREIEEQQNQHARTLLEMFEITVRVRALHEQRLNHTFDGRDGVRDRCAYELSPYIYCAQLLSKHEDTEQRRGAHKSYDIAKTALERTLGLQRGPRWADGG